MSTLLPFYLTDAGPNVIRPDDVHIFCAQNPVLKPFIVKYPPMLRLIPHPLFESLCCWIISQQIGGRVADKMIVRFKQACPETEPESILDLPAAVWGVGLSRAKVQTIQNLARFMLQHQRIVESKRFTSQEALAFFTQVKGIGEWTMQMHLIFGWGHPDILAAKDLAVRRGVQLLYSLDHVPAEKEVRHICKAWGDLATIGTLLAWAVVEDRGCTADFLIFRKADSGA